MLIGKKIKKILNLQVENNNELRELLNRLNFKIDKEGYLKSESGNYVKNTEDEPIKYKNVISILPGSKIVIEKGDYTALSRYFNNYLID
jgi:hypothetical protein